MEAEKPIQIVVADLHPIVRIGIRCLLEQASDLTLLGEAASSEEALNTVKKVKPDVLLLGMNLPVTESLRTAERLHEAAFPVSILVWSASEEESYVFEMLARGVSGYLTKADPPERLLYSLRRASSGEVGLLSSRITSRLITTATSKAHEAVSRLSRRENELLHLLAEGYGNNEIGERLHLSTKTVKNHITSIFGKLGVQRRAEVIAWAWRHGLVERR